MAVVAFALSTVAASSLGAQTVPNVLDNFEQSLVPCSDLCNAESPTARERDSCGAVGVIALSDITGKTSSYVGTIGRYRVAASIVGLVLSSLVILVAGLWLSRRRQYDEKILIASGVAVALLIAVAGWYGERFFVQAERDLLGADQELRRLTALGLMPVENPKGRSHCYLAKVIEDYGRNQEGTETSTNLMTYPGVFRRFPSLDKGALSLQGQIQQRADDLLGFLRRQNVALAANWQPRSAEEAIAHNGHLRGVVEDVLGLWHSAGLLWLGVFAISLVGAWIVALIHSALRRKAQKWALRAAQKTLETARSGGRIA